MNYKAENVDTDKALEHIEWSRKHQDELERLENIATKKYYEGVRKGLDIAEGIFECSNYEKQAAEVTYTDGVLDTLYELAKEIDVKSEDIRNDFKRGNMSLDDACAKLAERIKEKED